MNLSADIRHGDPSDLPAVLALLTDCGLPTADLESLSNLRLWVLDTEHVPLGVIALERFGRAALLRSLAVAPAHRRRGLGHRLVARLEEDARASGVRQLFLLTETAERFFLMLGYTTLDRTSVSEAIRQSAEFRSLCPVSAICMFKTLPAQAYARAAYG